MSVASEISRVQYAGNNSTVVPYGVPFYFLGNADIRVVLGDANGAETLLAEATHYVLTGAGNPAGGSLTTTVAYDGTFSLTIYREPQQTQSAEFQSTGALPADTLTRGLDKLTMLVQSLSRKLGRCFRLNDKAADVGALSEAAKANTVFGFDSAGDPALRDRSALLSLLSLSGSLQGAPTAYWADSGERALKTPDFVGQLGVQLGDSSLYRATGTSAGNWTPVSMTGMSGHISSENIEDGLISFSKLQNVSAPKRLMGRQSSGAGVAEEVTLSQVLDWIGSATQGDILYRGESGWARLAAGTAGLALVTKGAGQNPVWEVPHASGTVVKVSRVTDTGGYSTTVTTPAIDNTIPQISEGAQFFSTTYTPRLTTSTLFFRLTGWCSGTMALGLVLALFVDGGPDAIGATIVTVPSSSYAEHFVLACQYSNTTSTAKSITARFGTNTGVALICSLSGTQVFGTSDGVTLEIQEVAP